MSSYAKKTCWLVGAILFFILGLIGIILPVIPQIPFLVIAFFCLSKGAPKFHEWIRSTTFYQKYILKIEKKCLYFVRTNPFLKRFNIKWHE